MSNVNPFEGPVSLTEQNVDKQRSTPRGFRPRSALGPLTLGAVLLAAPAIHAQEPITLAEAMGRARTMTADARALRAAGDEAVARVRSARAGYWPRVDVSEGVQRGDQPVFVFSSLLAQRRFTAANFAIDELNHPSAVTNVRTAVAAEQSLFDGGLTRLAIRGAEIARDLTAAGRDGASADLALRAARVFVRVVQLEAAERADRAAIEAASSSLERARARRDAGLVTDADVLAVEVHLADMRQRAIGTTGDLEVARIELLEAIGAPLQSAVMPVRPALPPRDLDAEGLVREATSSRSDRIEATLRTRLAQNARQTAQAQFLPRIAVQGAWEFNGDTFTDQRSSWLVGAQVQLNLFRGFGDQARLAEARHAETRAEAERERVERRIEVEVRTALARLGAARAREAAGRAALAQAQESHRIVRDRYDSGLASITDVLRAAEAEIEAESRATAAEMDVILENVAVDRAVGRI